MPALPYGAMQRRCFTLIFGFCDECHAVLQADGGGHFPWCSIVQEKVTALIEEINMTVPTQADFDWASVTARTVTRLRKPKTPPPPPQRVIDLAMESYAGRVNPENPSGEREHIMEIVFDTTERAERFGKLIKKAGDYTEPQISVSVVVDPENLHTPDGRAAWRREFPDDDRTDEELTDLGGRTIRWRSGVRKGRK